MIGAIVVGFYPDFLILDKLLIDLLVQVDKVIYINNEGGEGFLGEDERKKEIYYVDLNRNRGLGFALNEGFRLASSLGMEFVATFDQDSVVPEGLISGLHKSFAEILEGVSNCAAIAPAFFDRREDRKIRFPFYREIDRKVCTVPLNITVEIPQVIEVDVLITSGMLVKTSVWEAGIHYDPQFFVDYTDTEWCFRARAAGYRIFADLSQEMGHSPSDGPPVRFLGLSFFIYSPLRRYYHFRNCIFFLRRKYVSLAWKKRMLMGLFIRFFAYVFMDNEKLKSLRMIFLGIFHGLKGKMGKF